MNSDVAVIIVRELQATKEAPLLLKKVGFL